MCLCCSIFQHHGVAECRRSNSLFYSWGEGAPVPQPGVSSEDTKSSRKSKLGHHKWGQSIIPFFTLSDVANALNYDEWRVLHRKMFVPSPPRSVLWMWNVFSGQSAKFNRCWDFSVELTEIRSSCQSRTNSLVCSISQAWLAINLTLSYLHKPTFPYHSSSSVTLLWSFSDDPHPWRCFVLDTALSLTPLCPWQYSALDTALALTVLRP